MVDSYLQLSLPPRFAFELKNACEAYITHIDKSIVAAEIANNDGRVAELRDDKMIVCSIIEEINDYLQHRA